MTAHAFCYWLQGCFELGKVTSFTPEQTEMIKRHLALVFIHDIDTPDPTGKSQAVHDGKPEKPTVNVNLPDSAPWKDPTVYRC